MQCKQQRDNGGGGFLVVGGGRLHDDVEDDVEGGRERKDEVPEGVVAHGGEGAPLRGEVVDERDGRPWREGKDVRREDDGGMVRQAVQSHGGGAVRETQGEAAVEQGDGHCRCRTVEGMMVVDDGTALEKKGRGQT